MLNARNLANSLTADHGPKAAKKMARVFRDHAIEKESHATAAAWKEVCAILNVPESKLSEGRRTPTSKLHCPLKPCEPCKATEDLALESNCICPRQNRSRGRNRRDDAPLLLVNEKMEATA